MGNKGCNDSHQLKVQVDGPRIVLMEWELAFFVAE